MLQQLLDARQKALQAFQKDLPQLMGQRPGQWMADLGDQQLGFTAHKHAPRPGGAGLMPLFIDPIPVRAMRSAGLRVEIDFAHDTISVWTP